jgi:hypothetical protein
MVGLGEDPAFEGLQEVVMVAEKCQVVRKCSIRPLVGSLPG